MTPEAMIVTLSAMGPVIGSGIGVLKRPTRAYIHKMIYIAADELMPAARNHSDGQNIFCFIFGIVTVTLLELLP